MSLVTRTLSVFLPLLLLLTTGGDGLPFFGLTGLADLFDTSATTNSTSLLAALAAAHAQHSIQTLSQLSDLATLAQNFAAGSKLEEAFNHTTHSLSHSLSHHGNCSPNSSKRMVIVLAILSAVIAG